MIEFTQNLHKNTIKMESNEEARVYCSLMLWPPNLQFLESHYSSFTIRSNEKKMPKHNLLYKKLSLFHIY